MVPVGRQDHGLARHGRSQARARGNVRRRILRRLLDQPLGGRPHRSPRAARVAGARARSQVSADRGPAHLRLAHRRVPHPRPSRGSVDERPMAALATASQRSELRKARGPAIPQADRFLCVRVAVPVIPRRLVPRCAARAPHRHRHRPLPQRRPQVPGALAARRSAGHRASFADPGGHGPGPFGWVLLRRPLQPRPGEGRRRGRSRLHRRARAPAGHRAVGGRGAGGVRPHDLQRLPTQHGASRDRCRTVAARGAGRRRNRSCGGAGAARDTGSEHPRDSLHRSEYRRDARRR